MSATKRVTATTRPLFGTLSLLGVLFVGLKLTHVIDWSWWFVTMPFWITAAFALVCFMIAGICLGIVALADQHTEKKRQARFRTKSVVGYRR